MTIGDEVLKAYGSGIYVQIGEKIKLEDLLYGLMLRSGNDAALAISVAVAGDTDKFVKMMNEKAKELGMKNTTFNNPSGLDEEKGNFSSAYDMAILMSYAMKNEEFRKITGTKDHTVKTDKNVYKWHNKNRLLSSYKYITGGKTGFTKIAKRTLVTSASKDGVNLTVVTINDGDDWDDHRNLYEEAFQEYTSYIYDCCPTSVEDVESRVVVKDLLTLERYTLNKLSEQRRKVYAMKRFQDKDVPEIAAELQLSIRTVENHLRLGRKTVREFIRQCI